MYIKGMKLLKKQNTENKLHTNKYLNLKKNILDVGQF
jgi:hypothetical protein